MDSHPSVKTASVSSTHHRSQSATPAFTVTLNDVVLSRTEHFMSERPKVTRGRFKGREVELGDAPHGTS